MPLQVLGRSRSKILPLGATGVAFGTRAATELAPISCVVIPAEHNNGSGEMMDRNSVHDWKGFFEEKAERAASNFEYDRGISPREKAIERLSIEELLQFVDPKPWETIFDAGCGTGANISLMHSKVKRIIGMDYSEGAIARCQRRLVTNGIQNVELIRGDLRTLPLSDNSVDKIVCMSVLQYLTDADVRKLFAEFVRILNDRGILILHVKNISSLYLSTLWAVKKAKLFAGLKTKLEHFRPFRWYVKELESSGFELLAYNSFNLFTIESMPKALTRFFEKLELKYYDRFPLRLGFMRRHGSELKIKGRVTKLF
jgi:ubiquinone/menaquinone biosynthesis C-methylase UbiE